MTLTLSQRLSTWVSVLAAIAALTTLLAACGGGGDGGSAGTDTGTGMGTGTGTGSTPTATVSITGPSRAVANTRYSYQASLPAVTNTSGIVWNWGDGSVDTTGSPVQKLWRKPGSFISTAKALAPDGTAVAASQGIVVVGAPVGARGSHSCALLPGGTVRCWGSNSDGQLGNGTTTTNTSTAVVTGLNDAVALTAGFLHSCAVQANGIVRCWGGNSNGQLGNATTVGSSITVAVTGLIDAVAVSAGVVHSCALQASGTVRCWGYNLYGQLGDGKPGEDSNIPVAVKGLSDAVALSSGGYHNCALQAGGTVRCWGDNSVGQMGNGTTGDSSPIVEVTGLDDAVALSSGVYHVCALQASGAVRCWGVNLKGQLGNGTTNNSSTIVTVKGLSNDVVALAAGANHTCALQASGVVRCWGANDKGQLGNGTLAQSSIAVPVTGLSDVVALTAGTDHTCALQATGAVLCWGLNKNGQLGDGTNDNKTVPTPVAGGAIFWK
jgi:alpha-tubulin suppressor-like RCC1 family protein